LTELAEARPPAASAPPATVVLGRNGVAAAPPRPASDGSGFRSYEVHQRLRVRQSTEKLNPAQLVSDDFARDPYPTLEILRTLYPCYLDWIGNSYWVSQYDDATSVFVDEANFETRSKLWLYGAPGFGRDLRMMLPVLTCVARRTDEHAAGTAEALIGAIASRGGGDLALEFAALFPLRLLARVLDLPDGDFDLFAERYWRMQRGYGWDPVAEDDGLAAMSELAEYFAPLLAARRHRPGTDLISTVAVLELPEGPATALDLVVTLLEGDHETLHGALANLLFLLLTHPDQLQRVQGERRLVKLTYLEALRHSAPVLTAARFARREVERFGLLLPEGARVVCTVAGHRDPTLFGDPDRFIVERKDLCAREPRGQYRADGLPSGIAFGLGPPSRYPALPQDRPRSLYALTRDTAVTAVNRLLDRLPGLRLQPGASPTLRSLRVGGMHTCWSLPVEFDWT
jgi:cytochrome P450